ncbi:MAG: manganese efflux pump MntP family protein [Synergistales bacterium]|nr:manganese efflux pump MntP family protein [Synergistales bacterium]
MITLLCTALALAGDAFALSLSAGACLPAIHWTNAFRMAAACGLFQFLMPLLGVRAGFLLHTRIWQGGEAVLSLFIIAVALHMLWEATHPHRCVGKDLTSGLPLLLGALATSLDAFAVGIGATALDTNVALLAPLTGIFTALLSYAGVYLGRKSREQLGTTAEFLAAGYLGYLGFRLLWTSLPM